MAKKTNEPLGTKEPTGDMFKKAGDIVDATLNSINDVEPLAEGKATVTVTTVPVDCNVLINGEEIKQKELPLGTNVVVVVSKPDFVAQTKEFVLSEENKNLTVTLEAVVPPVEEKATVTVTTTPVDAEVTINGTQTKTKELPIGTDVVIVTNKTGYLEETLKFKLSEANKNVTIDLEKQKLMVTVTPTPADATVTINDEETKTTELEYGTTVTVVVAKAGYIEKTVEFVLVEATKDQTIILEKEKLMVTVTADPEDATVTVTTDPFNNVITINGTVTKSKTLPIGSEVIVTAINEPVYEKKTVEFVLSEANKNQHIVLEKQKRMLIVNTIPEECTVKFDGIDCPEKQKEYPIDTFVRINVQCVGGYTEQEYNAKVLEDIEPMTFNLLNFYNVTVKSTLLDEAIISLNKQENVQANIPYLFQEREEVLLSITGKGYKPILKTIIMGKEDIVIEITEWKKPTLSVSIVDAEDEGKEVPVGVLLINEKVTPKDVEVEVDFESSVSVKFTTEGYEPVDKSYIIDENKNPIILKVNKIKEPTDGFLETITPLLKAKAYYSYLNCGRFFRQSGVTEETVRLFYQEFGYYVMSRIDSIIWNLMVDHYGAIEKED